MEADQIVGFEVNNADVRTIVTVSYPSLGFTEVVFDGSSFTALFSVLSTVVVVGGVQTFSIRRSPLWPEAPSLIVYAFASDGTEL